MGEFWSFKEDKVMSRIGRRIIDIPNKVTVKIDGQHVAVKGPKGELDRVLPEQVTLEQDGETLRVVRRDESRAARQRHGLSRTLVANMVEGVTKGFEKRLEIQGVGYRAALRGTALELSVGYSHTVVKDAPDGITFEVPTPTEVVVRGIDKQRVGQVAAEIRKVRPPEPY